jgi:hypothetical protein
VEVELRAQEDEIVHVDVGECDLDLVVGCDAPAT